MTMKIYGFFLFVFLTFHASAVDNLRLPDIRALGMGGNGVTLSTSYNPAMMEFSTGRVIRIDYFNRYALKELGSISGSLLYPNPYLSTAVQISSFGYSQYRQSMARIGLSKRLNTHWSAGISFQYTWIQSELYDVAPARLSTDIGVVYSPMDKLLIGIMVRDLPSVRISAKDIEIKDLNAYEIQLGLNYKVINNLLINAFLSVNESRQIRGGFGMEYTVWECFDLRVGMQAGSFLPSFGAGYRWKGFCIDAAALWHSTLGVSTGIGLSYSF